MLILGGSTEASALARALAGDARFAPVLSLAGRTRSPRPQPVPCRTGGFGGVDGLVAHLRDAGIQALVDATHPFAAVMSAHAVQAAARARVPLLRIERPAWVAGPGDAWTGVPDMAAAVRALGSLSRRVLLTVGQQELASFAAAPWHHYVIRSIDPPDPATLPPHATPILDPGPFTVQGETALLRRHGIEVLVSKNAGGGATAAKLEAARLLGLPVVMVARPVLPEAPGVPDAEAALFWLHAAWRGA